MLSFLENCLGILAPVLLLLCCTLRLNATLLSSQGNSHNNGSVSEGGALVTETVAISKEDEGNFTFGSGEVLFEDNSTDTGLEEGEILFEGDIVISLETLRKYYDINETMEKELLAKHGGDHGSHVSKRAATSDETMLWPSKTVPYVISTDFTDTQRENILQAMRNWSDETCIRFVARSYQPDYISFIKNNSECNSYIGRVGGRQYIRLTSGCARSQRSVLHEIGHALGLWHEQSRPDRDSYVTILWDNIEEKYRFAFRKRIDRAVDYQGTGYDYGSIMHYPTTAFVKPNCSGCQTIVVNNNAAYISQSSPELGRGKNISDSDAIQIRRLYKCPGQGQEGLLRLYICYGRNLEDTDTNIFTGDPDPYVKIKAISSTGSEYTKQTSHKQGTQNPTWNKELFLGYREWQFFRISVWDNDIIGDDDPMGMSVTVPLLNQPRTARYKKYCTSTACDRYIWYDYELLPVTTGRLRVKVRYARNLPDTDAIGRPDPYVRVGVLRSSGSTRYQNSNVKGGTTNPTWNTWLSLSLSERTFANRITAQVFDDDVFFDDSMSDPQSFDISPGYHSSLRHCVSSSCNAYLIFDYEFLFNKYERRLRIYARYGRNLPDEDGFLAGDSDPYLKVVAYDINGNSRTKKTSKDQGDEDPEWYETLDFGVGMWTRFEVSVWDADVGSDDRLSSTHRISLPSSNTISRTGVRRNCYSGYVVFNYHFN